MSHSLPWNKTNTKILSKDAFKTTNHVLIGLKFLLSVTLQMMRVNIKSILSSIEPWTLSVTQTAVRINEHINTTRLPLIRVKEMQWTHWPAVLRSRFTVDLWPDLYAWHLGGCDPGDAAVVLQRPVSVMCAYVYRFECVCVCERESLTSWLKYSVHLKPSFTSAVHAVHSFQQIFMPFYPSLLKCIQG